MSAPVFQYTVFTYKNTCPAHRTRNLLTLLLHFIWNVKRFRFRQTLLSLAARSPYWFPGILYIGQNEIRASLWWTQTSTTHVPLRKRLFSSFRECFRQNSLQLSGYFRICHICRELPAGPRSSTLTSADGGPGRAVATGRFKARLFCPTIE